MAVDVCNGGTIAVGATSIAFTNSTGGTVTLSNCQLFRGSVGVPPGNFNLPIAPAAAGNYPYNASGNCAGIKGTLPAIKVQ